MTRTADVSASKGSKTTGSNAGSRQVPAKRAAKKPGSPSAAGQPDARPNAAASEGAPRKRKKKKAAPAVDVVAPAPRLVRPESPDWLRAEGRAWLPRHDSTRPHVRFGILWFLAVTASLLVAPLGLAVVYGAAASLGAAQTARAWQLRGQRPNLVVAAGCAALLPLAACFGSEGAGAAVLVATAASVLVAPGSVAELTAAAGVTVRSWLFIGVAAASPVLVADIDLGAAVALVLLVSAFECGDYLMGTDARFAVTGPLGGAAAVGVLSFSLFVVALPPFGGAEVVPYALVTALLAPVGQVLASLILPDGRAIASGLRRLDSLLVVGPAWLILLWTRPL